MFIANTNQLSLQCRACGTSSLEVFLDLGIQPIANALLERSQLGAPESRFPLQLSICRHCSLVQVTHSIPPDVLFGQHYPYYSSFIPALLSHSREHALAIVSERKLNHDSLVVEIGSNDGYLLRNFVERGVPVIGIDPAHGPVAAAQACGISTVRAYFSSSFAKKMLASGKLADVVIANNVIAHVEAIHDFVGGISLLLKRDGVAFLEFAYLRDLIEKCEFDTIYHEHLFYHSLTALSPIFESHSLFLNDAERIPIHGGSLRIRVSKSQGATERLQSLVREEATLGIGSLSYYHSFAERVRRRCSNIVELVQQLRAGGAKVVAYGAAAKGATLLNYSNIGRDLLEYVVDRNPHKVGKYMPGVRLPIRPVEYLARDNPDYVLLLAWNFAPEIIEQSWSYTRKGGKFILPLPEPQIV